MADLIITKSRTSVNFSLVTKATAAKVSFVPEGSVYGQCCTIAQQLMSSA